jgi:hypothetical protein
VGHDTPDSTQDAIHGSDMMNMVHGTRTVLARFTISLVEAASFAAALILAGRADQIATISTRRVPATRRMSSGSLVTIVIRSTANTWMTEPI